MSDDHPVSDDFGCYPGTDVVVNNFDIRDAVVLDNVERFVVAQRERQGVPSGNFDMEHLCDIHRQLFQDMYSWAGEVRDVDLAKSGDKFQSVDFVETGMANIHKRLVEDDFLRGLDEGQFCERAGRIIGDLIFVHPFREGNGRTALQYLKQLGEHAGHEVTLTEIDPDRWIEASQAAHTCDYTFMSRVIGDALLGPDRDWPIKQDFEQIEEPLEQADKSERIGEAEPVIKSSEDKDREIIEHESGTREMSDSKRARLDEILAEPLEETFDLGASFDEENERGGR